MPELRPYLLLALATTWVVGMLAEVAIAQHPAPSALWFEDLVDAKPLPPASQKDLATYITRLALDPEARYTTLPKSLLHDREPRLLFLSLSDGVTRARILRATGLGLAEAVEHLRAELFATDTGVLVASGFKPQVARFDLVTEVQAIEVDPAQPLKLDRSLYGLAFERQMGLAFLADEVVTHTLINNDQKLRLRNVLKRSDQASVKSRLHHLRKSAKVVPLFRFATASFFSDGGPVPLPLFRGHRLFADLGPEELLQHAELGGRYLARSIDDNGRFVYAYLPKTDENKEQYNALRHCGTVYSMLEVYEVTKDPEILSAARRGIDYLEKSLLGRCRVGDAETSCIIEDGEVKLGGNGLAMVALAKYVEVTGDQRHLETIDELGRWILLTQGEDGEFKIHKQLHPSGEVTDFVSGYYPGEALLALVRRPEPNAAWLDAAARGARWLIEVRDKGLAIEALNHDHWLLYALSELHQLRPDPLYLAHATRITSAILGRQRGPRAKVLDWAGSYYTPPRSTPTATRSEGLAAAYLMMRDGGQAESAAAILEALKLGVQFQLQTQFLPETVLYLRDPARALGGFHRSLTNYEIRIDYVQHNISALLALRRILLEKAGPSLGLGNPP